MVSKYENYNLKDLTFEYFEMNKRMNKIRQKINETEKEFSSIYALQNDLSNMIRKKQDEEDEIIKNNLHKYGLKVQLADNEQLNRDYWCPITKEQKEIINDFRMAGRPITRENSLTLSELKNKY
jgi:uncharacterized membrane-anchored protein YjiN (DUF445 family)